MFPAPTLYPNRPEEYDPELHSSYYDYVLLWGSHSRIENDIQVDFVPIFQQGQMKLYSRRSAAAGEARSADER
jgi:hypothetical protein